MEYFRCEGADCGYVTTNPDLEVCPHCGGNFFIPVEEEYISGYGWMCLFDEAQEDPAEALEYLRHAVDSEYPPAIFRMGRCYQHGELVEQDINKARELFFSLGDREDDPAAWIDAASTSSRPRRPASPSPSSPSTTSRPAATPLPAM